MDKEIVVTAWNNGQHSPSGSSYGLRVPPKQRDAFFSRSWTHVVIFLPKHDIRVEVNVAKESFWNNCPELISCEIGKWLLAEGFAPWSKGRPPRFTLRPMSEGEFELRIPNDETPA